MYNVSENADVAQSKIGRILRSGHGRDSSIIFHHRLHLMIKYLIASLRPIQSRMLPNQARFASGDNGGEQKYQHQRKSEE